MKRIVSAILLCVAVLSPVYGQGRSSFEEYKAKKNKEFNKYKTKKNRDFSEYRKKRNEQFAYFLRKKWMAVNSSPAIPRPKDEVVPPLIVPENDIVPVAPNPTPIPFDDVVPAPNPLPQPSPIDPIMEIPIDSAPVDPVKDVPAPKVYNTFIFNFFGTPASVRLEKASLFKLNSLDENSIADGWLKLSEDSYTNLIYDCLKIRKDYNLDDWPYLMMLRQMAESVYGAGSNESVLLMAYVYCQSGYKMRLAKGGGKLYMLFASDYSIYDNDYYKLNNQEYYVFGKTNQNLKICNQQYPKEKSMSLLMSRQPLLAYDATSESKHKSTRNQDMIINVVSNKNMLKFYDSYPTSMTDNNFMTRWALYANMSMPDYIQKSVYPQIRSNIEGLSQLEALNKILNWIQTGFVYEEDNKVWGRDRAFFPEESLHYPYCDCEDRSILLSRIVRDILGLKCVLVYYPGHLAAAVAVTEGNPTGDYFDFKGSRFFITDPTITGYGASVGTTMSKMNNSIAKLILLDN